MFNKLSGKTDWDVWVCVWSRGGCWKQGGLHRDFILSTTSSTLPGGQLLGLPRGRLHPCGRDFCEILFNSPGQQHQAAPQLGQEGSICREELGSRTRVDLGDQDGKDSEQLCLVSPGLLKDKMTLTKRSSFLRSQRWEREEAREQGRDPLPADASVMRHMMRSLDHLLRMTGMFSTIKK